MVILLALKGVIIYFPSRKTRISEYEYESIPHIDMTSKAPVWEPYQTSFSEQENIMTDFRGGFINKDTITRGRRIINSLSTIKNHALYFTDDDNFYKLLNSKVNVA